MIENVRKIAAFTYDNKGGNPAGVLIADQLPSELEMQNIAKEIGYSETAFLEPHKEGWRIRYFAPEIEIPFCGHATIASGAVLGDQNGEGRYKLYLNNSEILIDIRRLENKNYIVELQSPETWTANAPQIYIDEVLDQFNFTSSQLDPNFPIRFAFGGAKHLIIALKDRSTLSRMNYNFENLKQLMLSEGLATISLCWFESDEVIHSRNPFAAGGVYEDPATGGAAAALAGYLRDIKWNGKNRFQIIQGEDMGCPCRLHVKYTPVTGESIKVSGETRYISDKRNML